MSKSTTRNIPAVVVDATPDRKPFHYEWKGDSVDTDADTEWFDEPTLRSAAELNLASRDEDGNITLRANIDMTGSLTGTQMDHRDAERFAEAIAIIELYASATLSLKDGPAVVTLHKAALDYNYKQIELGLPELPYDICSKEVSAAWLERGSNKLYRTGRLETSRPIKMTSKTFSDVNDSQIIFCHMSSGSQYYKTGVATCMALAYTPTMFKAGTDKQTHQPYTYPDLWNDYKGYTHIVRFFPDSSAANEAYDELRQAVYTVQKLEPLAPQSEPQYGEQLPLAARYKQGIKLTAG